MSYTTRYDQLLRSVISILRSDYACSGELPGEYDPKFYLTAAAVAHRNSQLSDLLFMRYTSQMLATTLDRSLRLHYTGDGFQPCHYPGFFARRLGDELIVTDVFEESRLCVGDRIEKINSDSPGTHRAQVQKNFFYSDQPERELWNGVLKMAQRVTVRRSGGLSEQLILGSYPYERLRRAPSLKRQDGDTLLLDPGDLDSRSVIADFLSANKDALSRCSRLILDLRRSCGSDCGALLPLLPYITPVDASVDSLVPPLKLRSVYSENNLRLLGLSGEPYTADETVRLLPDAPETIPGKAPPRLLVLSDTFCEDAAEELLLAARRAGHATIVGRPSMGTLDCWGILTAPLGSGFYLSYPMSRRLDNSTRGVGVPVDSYVPFSQEDVLGDAVLRAAMSI